MKYFSPSYWLKLWVLSSPLFNDKTQGVYAKSINNKNIKDWASENTTSLDLISNNNNSEFITHQTHLDTQNLVVNLSQDTSTDSSWNLEARPKNDQQAALWEHAIEEQHHHDLQAEHNRHKRQDKKEDNFFHIYNTARREYLYAAADEFAYDDDRRRVFTWKNKETLGEEGIWQLQATGSDDEYNIYNAYQREYLYAADYAPYDNDRRRVFTWREKNQKSSGGVWRVFISSSNSCIYNIHHSEYLYSPNDFFTYDNDRRRVFTWREKNTCVNTGGWTLEKALDYSLEIMKIATYSTENKYIRLESPASAFNHWSDTYFTPEFWEEIVFLKNKTNNKEKFIEKFMRLIPRKWITSAGLTKYERKQEIKFVAAKIYEHFETISNLFIHSSKKKQIQFHLREKQNWGGAPNSFNIWTTINNEINYSNRFLDNLQRDFQEWNQEIEINLGLIDDDNDTDIKNAIKPKYKNLIVNDIKIVEKDYSYFHNPNIETKSFGGFKAKSYIKESSIDYSYGPLKPTFSYVTQTKLNELSNTIANDTKVKLWIEHINEYHSTFPIRNKKLDVDIQLFKDTYPQGKELNEKISTTKEAFKIAEKEIIKVYIRDWSHVHTLIEHELKLDELNKNVQGLKSNFETLKNQINDLNTRVTNLEKPNNCATDGYIVSGAFGVVALTPIPIVQQVAALISAIAGTAAAICSL